MRLRQATKKALKGVAAFLFDKAWNYETRSKYTPFKSQDTLDLEGKRFSNFLLSNISCLKGIDVFSVLFPFSKILSCVPCGDANESAFFFSKGLLLFNQLMLLRPTQKNCSFYTLHCSLVLRHLVLQSVSCNPVILDETEFLQA